MKIDMTASNWDWAAGQPVVKSDNRWQSGLRWQQVWWRQVILNDQPAGPISATNLERTVSSMLPLEVGLDVNLMTPEAVASYVDAKADLVGRPGMIQEDRLRRNLLSSQPLCFNLFGLLSRHPEALLPWLRELDETASEVTDVRLEWAPRSSTIGGSAFDAFVVYLTSAGSQRFVGIECKYAEDLAKAQPKKAALKWFEATSHQHWLVGAAERLDRPKLRQFWFNQILGQVVADMDEFEDGVVVVVACDADVSARDSCASVATELCEPSRLRFSSIEHVVSAIEGHDDWKRRFTERYTDFTPIQHLLSSSDPRRSGV